jgi:hypothetical protein
MMVAITTGLVNAQTAYASVAKGKLVPSLRYLALTGGLSCNNYIRHAVQDRVEQEYPDSVRVILMEGNSG